MENFKILTINAGSSSIKFAVYDIGKDVTKKCSGKIDRIGMPDTGIAVNEENKTTRVIKIEAGTFHIATLSLIDWVKQQEWFTAIKVLGHRVVHGMQHTEAEVVTPVLIKELQRISNYDPDHLPAEIEIIEMFQQQFPDLLQVACFDTSFHTTIPPVANTFAIPKKYTDEGVKKYGFHGLSYSYLVKELAKQNETGSRLILAHLGSGASIAAVKDGKCIDTSMGFTPAGGIVMATRSGDLDPGIAWYLMQAGITAESFNDIINHQSGLLGISGISADMKDLLQQKENEHAQLAINIFCYQVKKYIGAYMAALGGLDILVFSGGIGENSHEVRKLICESMEYAGIKVDEKKNAANESKIYTDDSAVKVFVIPTDEENIIATMTSEVYFNHKKNN